MTIEQLRKIFPDATLETWHQHTNGGGWVQNTAHVDDTAWVSGDAQVFGDAQVYGDARVFGDAQVRGDARVYGDAWEQSPFFVKGTSWSVTSSTWDKLQIGCKSLTVKEWLEHGEEIGRENDLSAAQIAEYLAIVRCWDEIRHIRGLVKEPREDKTEENDVKRD